MHVSTTCVYITFKKFVLVNPPYSYINLNVTSNSHKMHHNQPNKMYISIQNFL